MTGRVRDPEVPPLEPALRELFDAAQVDPVIGGAAFERVVARAGSLTGASAPALKSATGTLIAKGVGVVSVMGAVLGLWIALTPGPSAPVASREDNEGSERRTPAELGNLPPAVIELDASFVVELPQEEPARPRRRTSRAAPPAQDFQIVDGDVVDDDEVAPSEGAILFRARAALTRDAERCLSLTNEHRRLYPNGLMREERDVLEVEALARLERAAEARRRAVAFERTYPSSPYLERIRRAVQ